MKHHYFMNKPEVLEAEEYESPDGYISYYYKRSDRIARRRNPQAGCMQKRSVLSKSGSGKGRKIIYFLNLILIFIIFLVWSYLKNQNDTSQYVEDKTWKYYIKLSPEVLDEQELNLYIQNVSSKQRSLKQSYQVIYFYGTGQDIHKNNVRKVKIDRELRPSESYNLVSIKVNEIAEGSIDRVGLYIDDKIMLVKLLKDETK